jgi:uncharacterized protein with GYD domain
MQAVQDLVGSVGGSVELFYWATGKDDYYLVASMPDAHAALAVSIGISATGSVTATTAELFDAAAMDDIVSRRMSYRAPGA